MSNEKHEMVCYNNDCYICVYAEGKEDRCCCISLRRVCKNSTKSKLFPVFIIDTEYLNMFINISMSHPDLIVGILCSNDKLCIRIIEVKRIVPGSEEISKISEIRKAIDDQLVNFFFSRIVQQKLNMFNINKEKDIKLMLVVPQNVHEYVSKIVNQDMLPKLIRKYKLPALRTTTLDAIKNNLIESSPCVALNSSCDTYTDEAS